jgi:predicted benzoate:H+ symporter BenE
MSKPVATVATHEDDRQRLTVLGVIMHTFPERHDYLMGESYYGLVASLVPRWLWPDKGKHFMWRDTAIVYNLTGLPAPTPMPGVLFANFSWAGVVIGMALLGSFHRALYRRVEQAPGDPGTALIYIAILGSFTPTLLGISQTLQWVVPVVVLVLLVSRAAPKSDEVPASNEVAPVEETTEWA